MGRTGISKGVNIRNESNKGYADFYITIKHMFIDPGVEQKLFLPVQAAWLSRELSEINRVVFVSL